MLGTIFSFSGRSGRLAYFVIGLVQLAALALTFGVMIGLAPKGAAGSPGGAAAGGLIMVLVVLALAWTGLAATVRRLRDMGWPILIGLLAVTFLPFVSLLLLFWPGNGEGDNDISVFSDDPKPDRPAKRPAKDALSPDLAWMRSPAKPYVPVQTQANPSPKPILLPNGARAQFGLRGQQTVY